MAAGTSPSSRTADRRERALSAFLRQEFSVPVAAMTEFLEMIIEDARRDHLDDAIPDLEKMRIASTELNALVGRLIDMPNVEREQHEDFETFQGRLRHDLRTPINAIKGYGEMLREDAADGSAETFVADLDKLLAEATLLLGRIDGLVTHSDGDAPPSESIAPAATEIAAAASMSPLEAVRPPAAKEADPAAARPGRILVVDDNEDNRFTLTRRLTREGYKNLGSAVNGREALDRLRADKFDLVLLDVTMPEMNGYQVLEHMSADARMREIPVIMISALDQIDGVVRCIELGADDYLQKPFNPVLLRARVGASLEKKRLRDEVRASLKRLERELDAARTLQAGMLPHAFPQWSLEQPMHVHAIMEPAREVGGDLYDCFSVGDRAFYFLVGDVSEKGAPAAMFMARTRSLVRMAVELRGELAPNETRSPAAILATVNRELCQNNDERMFVTLFLGILDVGTGAMTYVNAGHPPPFILHPSGELAKLTGEPELPLGIRRNAQYHDGHLTLGAADTFFVYSDGVPEAMNSSDELFGFDRLAASLTTHLNDLPHDLVPAVKVDLDAFAGSAPKADDVTMLALRWSPALEGTTSF
jgi:sigma-B regulation protein RsbU (phosphoserine phosphatase)